jgi:glycosyltransferase involved in cell wall biosynthesis
VLKFSVFIPTFNAEPWLPSCLESVGRQAYPRECIEVIVVDGGSTDRTREIAARHGARVFDNPQRLAHYAFEIFGRETTGDLVVMFAADNELTEPDWFRAVTAWFEAEPELGALWCPQVSGPADPPANRYYALIQNDPLSFFTNRNLSRYLRRGRAGGHGGRNGTVFEMEQGVPLVWGANGLVLRLAWCRAYFTADAFVGDNDVFQSMVDAGHRRVAYLRDLHVTHHHIRSVRDWTRKLKRNFQRHFLEHHEVRNMGWAFGHGFYGRLFLWVIYAGIPVFSGADALWRAVRDRNAAWLYHPVLNFIQFYVYVSLTLTTRAGWGFLRRLCRGRD